MRILVVEDEQKVGAAVSAGLTAEGFDVLCERDGEAGFYRACTESFEVILLDIGLPGRSGLEVLAALRARGVRTRVLMMTARDAIADRVAGLDGGADDYLVKPFAFAELLARIRALARRGSPQPVRFRVGDLTLDVLARTAERAGQKLDLTGREFELLEDPLRHGGQIVSRESLARDVWQEAARTTPLDNVIDVHITRLRKKVDADAPCRLIDTLRGVGFMLSEQAP